MRGFKRTISILLSLLIILSVFTTAPFTVNAEQTTDLSPAYVAYQAKRYSDPNGQNLFGDASRTYAQTYYNQMKKDNKVISGITIWEAAHIATSPTYSLESGLITKKDMYKLAIFDMLDLSESDTFVSNLLDMVNDSRLSYIVSVSKSICDPNDINVSELKNFEVNAEYINFLKESAKLAKAFDVVDKISTIASGCKNLYEAILTTANYQAISDMKNGTKEVLSAIYADTSNPSELRQAAYECVNNFGDGFDRILNTVSTGSNLCLNATLETIFKEAVDSIWSEIISVIPGGKVVMTAAKGMRVLSNAVFAMDDTCRIYYQFEADVTLEQAVRNVMNNARCDYIQDNNQDKAIAYMRAVEMYKRIVLQGYDYTKEMLEIKANAPATKWFDWFNHDYSECMELMEGVESIKNNKQKLYKQFEDWVHSDYINLYCKDYNETINDFNNQQTIKTDSVTLTQIKDINVGDSGYIYDYIMKTCQPENSTEYKKCYFTAENKDAFTIDKLGSFVAESAGQVTLIYDKGGELESSVTITVGSSPTDNKHDYYSDFKYSTFYNNSQQRTEATITEYTGSQSNLIIPYSIDGYIVTSIGRRTFIGCTSLKSINIPDSVTNIDDSAFYGCTSLTSINIPDGVTSIGDWAFEGCTSLTSINIPDGVTCIGGWAFKGCSSLTSINIPDSVTNIGDSAFYGCTSLTSITIPDGITSIGDSTFRSCTSLTSINIPDSVKSIGNFTFSGCTNLTSINIPDGVTSIGGGAFSSCTSLTSINIPDRVKSIGNFTFKSCTSLISIKIPDSVTSIGDSAFYCCTNLTSINIPDSLISIGSWAFDDCKSLTNITIPDSVISIGNYAFSGCSSLTSIKIPNSVTSIGDAANYDLSDVLFMGSKEQWNSITMVSDNFSNAAIHYNAEYIKTVEPDCTNKGYDLYSCSECENGVKVNFTDALGHDFINGICERCGKDELDCIESAHPYENDTDEKWTIHKNNAKRIAVVFSDKTETESGSDYIYIYDKDNEEIGCYSGTELAGKRIVVQGDTVTIRLTSDSSNTCYGFDITDVKPYYEECVHSETELINVREAGCGWEGYTGDVRCVECQEILSYGKYIDATEEHSIISEIIPPTCGHEGYTHHYCENCDYSYDDNYVDATGNHEFENGICKICGQPDIDCLENFKANDTKNIEITNGGEFKYFKFTPNKNGTLNFYSVGTCDTYGCLFDSEMTELAYNDDGSEDYNFSITYDVIAGKTYILACRMYSSDTIGNFNTVLNFEPDDTALIGDVDGNGEVSIADATEIQKYLVQYVSFNEEQLKVSDTNGDGKVDIKDVTQIQKYIVQLISSLV